MTMSATPNKCSIGLIGFGEVGTTFSRGFLAAGGYDIAVYDILMDDPDAKEAMAAKARSIGVRACASAAQAAQGAAIIISAVTASSAVSVAGEAGSYMKPGQLFLDINSVSPATKRHDAELVERSGADYVEAAVMAPVAPYGLKVPIVLGGKRGAEVKELLDPAGMRLELGEHEIGRASALKMCRSVMVKGLEALAVECFTVARLYGIEEKILASLSESYPGMNWEHFAGYKIGRVIEHGRRRAAEMREAAETVAETGLEPLMSRAIAGRIDWAADLVAAEPGMKEIPDKEWRTMVDSLARGAGLRRLGEK
jgi:3-hydroxyisobutyrate dehydrogenase-like beta-hydroxyacid dehydrogenase